MLPNKMGHLIPETQTLSHEQNTLILVWHRLILLFYCTLLLDIMTCILSGYKVADQF